MELVKSEFGKIYKIINTINSRVYIGQTTRTLAYRFSRHKYDSSHPGRRSVIGSAINKHGMENFSIIEIDIAFSKNELDEKEIYYIQKYDSIKNGYNVSTGGSRGGSPHTPETIEKLRKISTGKSTQKRLKDYRAYEVRVE
jgi:group I intron endonuclease